MKLICFQITDERRVFLSQFFSRISDIAFLITAIWSFSQVYTARELSLFLLFASLPSLFVFLFSANLINRYGPLRVIRFTCFFRGLALIAMGIFIKHPALFSLCFIALFNSFFAGLFNPSVLSLPAYLSNDKQSKSTMMARLVWCLSIAAFLAPVLAYIAYNYLGLRCFFLFLGVLYIFSVAIIYTLKINAQGKSSENKYTFSIGVVLRYKTVFHLLVSLFFIGLLITPLQLFIPLYVKTFYHSDMIYLVCFQITLSVGVFLGGAFLSLIKQSFKIERVIVFSYMMLTIAFALFAWTQQFILCAISFFLLGLFSSIGNILLLSYFQNASRKEDFSHVMACTSLVSTIVNPLSFVLAGALLTIMPVYLQVRIYSFVMVGFSLLIYFSFYGLRIVYSILRFQGKAR